MLTKPDAVFKVSKILEHESNRWRASDIYLDQYSGKVWAVEDAYQSSLGSYIDAGTLSLHNGTFGGGQGTIGGGLTRLLYLWLGIVPTILFATGLGVWWNKRRHDQTRKRIVRDSISVSS
jgi:uncharacterized iron-regulated membrane protein